MTTNDMGPNSDANSVQQMIAAIATVKRLVAAGLLDAAALGVALPAPQSSVTNTAPGWALVPGEPILMRDLIAKTKAGITTSSTRAWAGYLDFLVDGYHDRGIDYDGIGDKFAHEVLPSDLRVALEFVGKRAATTAQERATVRESVGRAVRRSSGAGAQGNAVAAWRRAFKVAVEDRHIATHSTLRAGWRSHAGPPVGGGPCQRNSLPISGRWLQGQATTPSSTLCSASPSSSPEPVVRA